MTIKPSETLPDNYWIDRTGDNPGKIITTTFTNHKTSLFQRIIDSFKRGPPSENVYIEMNELK
jgi:hypothetical protein